jgi:membrane-associated phospholipid phosphatase
VFAQLAQRLRDGEIETQSAFDPRALPTYVSLLLGISITASLIILGGFSFSSPLARFPPIWCAMLVSGGLLARRYGHSQVGGACESIGLLYSQSMAIGAATPMLTAYSAPLADDLLARGDRALGFDWYSYVMLFRDSWLALRLVGIAYMSFLWEAVVILVALFALGQNERAWRFVLAAAISLLLTIAVYPLVPAVGGFIHFHITPTSYPNLGVPSPWSFAPAIEAMKSGTKVITTNLLVGYVSFPSYHAATAVLFTWAAWRLGKVRWLFVAVNFCMTASAMIIGAHYLVDLIGGFAIASIGIGLANRAMTAVEERIQRRFTAADRYSGSAH